MRGSGKGITTHTRRSFLAHIRIVPGLLYRYCVADRVSSVDGCSQDALLVSIPIFPVVDLNGPTFFLHQLRNSSKGATLANRRSRRYKSVLAHG